MRRDVGALGEIADPVFAVPAHAARLCSEASRPKGDGADGEVIGIFDPHGDVGTTIAGVFDAREVEVEVQLEGRIPEACGWGCSGSR